MISQRLANILLVATATLLAVAWHVGTVELVVQAVAALFVAGQLFARARPARQQAPRPRRRR